MQELHQMGYILRNLNPENIMFQHHTGTWVLTNLRHAVKIGRVAPIDFLPTYAPPEVVLALSSNGNHFRATTAVDAWGIGMIAMELLLQTTVLWNDHEAIQKVCLPDSVWLCKHRMPRDILPGPSLWFVERTCEVYNTSRFRQK